MAKNTVIRINRYLRWQDPGLVARIVDSQTDSQTCDVPRDVAGLGGRTIPAHGPLRYAADANLRYS